MLVFVDTTNGSTLPIELNSWDRVLDIKKKIEKSQGIAVSSQELYYKGHALLIDDLDLKVCNIVNYSRLLLVLPDEDYYQVLLQTEQFPPPSNYITNIEDSLGKIQAWPVTATRNNRQMLHQTEHSRVPPSDAIEAFDNQGLPAMAWSNDDQMLQQTEQSPVPQAFFNQGSPAMARSNDDQELHETVESLFPDMPVTAEDISKMQSWTAEGNVNIQEPLGRNDNNQDLLQRESSHPSNTFSFSEDRFLSAEHVTNSQSNLPASTTEEIITEQAPAPSKYITNIEDSLGNNQGWPMMASSNNTQMLHQTKHSQVPPSNILEAFFDKDRPELVRSYDDQMLHQPEKSLLSSFTIDELLHLVPETPLTDQEMRKMQGDWPESATEGNVNNQETSERNDNQDLLQKESSNSFGDFSFIEFPLSAKRFSDISYLPASTTGDIINENQVLQTEQSTVPSHSTEQRINTHDLPMRVENSDQVVQREKSPPIREVITIPDSPVKVSIFKKPPQKLRVMVLPYSRENKPVSKFPVNVNASEKVGELRKELEKIQQRSPLDLPQKGYFFIHKQRMLDDAQSFAWNGVAHGDTIEIISGHVTI